MCNVFNPEISEDGGDMSELLMCPCFFSEPRTEIKCNFAYPARVLHSY